MPSYPVILLKSFVYAGRRYPAGARLDTKAVSDVRLLKALGIAIDAPVVPDQATEPEHVDAPTLSDDDAQDDDGTVDESVEAPPEKAKRRRYRRADMRAEDE